MNQGMKKNIVITLASFLFLALFIYFGSNSHVVDVEGYLYDKGDVVEVAIKPNKQIKQKLDTIMTDMKELSYFSNDATSAEISIYDGRDTLLKRIIVASDNGKLSVPLNDLELFNGKELKITIVNKGKDSMHLQSIINTKFNKADTNSFKYNLKTNFKGVNKTYRKTFTIVSGAITCILLVLLYFMSRKSSRYQVHVDSVLKKLKKYKLTYAIETVLVFSLLMLLMNSFVNLWYLSEFSISLWLLTFIVMFIFIGYFLELLYRSKAKIECIFVIVAIPLLFMYLFLMVPNSIPDEVVHFSKTYLTSQFKWGTYPYAEIPSSMTVLVKYNYKEWQDLLFTSTNYESVTGIATCSYNFILYLIPSIGFMIGKLFNLSIFFAYLLARSFNVLFYVGIGYYCIKKIPFGKWLLFVFLLNPMILHLSSSLSADNLVNCMSILTISYCFYIYKSEKPIVLKDIIILGSAFIILAITKYNYLPLFGLLLISYKKVLQMDKKLWLYVIVIPIVSVVAYLFFSNLTAQANLPATPIVDVNPGAQLSFILHNPLEFLKTLLRTSSHYGEFYITSMLLSPLSWLSLTISSKILSLYLVILAIAIMIEDSKVKLKMISKGWIIVLSGIMIFAVYLALYITWTSVGGPIIEGIQGRYFLPIGFLLLLLTVGRKKLYINNPHVKIVGMLLIMHSYVLYCILRFFN